MIQQLYLIKQERKYLLDDQEEIKESRIKLENDLKDAILDYKDTKNYLKEIEKNSNFISDKINIYDNKILYINENIDEYEQCEEMFEIKKEIEDELKEFKENETNINNQLIEIQGKKNNHLKRIKILKENIITIQNYEIYLSEKVREIDEGILNFENIIREEQMKNLINEKKYKLKISKFNQVKNKFCNAIIYENCQICLNNFYDDDEISLFTCQKHIFHFKCLNEWIQYKPVCPICRELYSEKKE